MLLYIILFLGLLKWKGLAGNKSNRWEIIILGTIGNKLQNYPRRVNPRILYGILQKAPQRLPPPIPHRRVVAKVVEPKYDVVYPHGVGGRNVLIYEMI